MKGVRVRRLIANSDRAGIAGSRPATAAATTASTHHLHLRNSSLVVHPAIHQAAIVDRAEVVRVHHGVYEAVEDTGQHLVAARALGERHVRVVDNDAVVVYVQKRNLAVLLSQHEEYGLNEVHELVGQPNHVHDHEDWLGLAAACDDGIALRQHED